MAVGDEKDGVIPDVVVDRNGEAINTGGQNEYGLSDDEAKLFQDMQTADARQPSADVDADSGDPDAGGSGETRARDGSNGEAVIDLPGDRKEQPQTDNDALGDDFELPAENPAQQTISYGRHRRELKAADERRKAAATAARKTAEENTVLRTRMEMLLDAFQKGGKQAPAAKEEPKADPVVDDPRPDPDEKPFEYSQWLEREVLREREARLATEARISKMEGARETDAEESVVAQAYLGDARALAGELAEKFGHPLMFTAAYEHLKGSRFRELSRTLFFKPLLIDGKYNVTEAEYQKIEARFRLEEKHFATESVKNKVRPAMFVWEFATDRGFDPVATKAALLAHDATKGKPNGKEPAKEEPKPSVTEEVKALDKRIKDSVSLSDGGSAPAGQQLTVNKVAAMDDKEFAALLDTMEKGEYEAAILGA